MPARLLLPLFLVPALLVNLATFLAPMLNLAMLSFREGMPGGSIGTMFTWATWQDVLTDPYYAELVLWSVALSLFITVLTLLCAYPIALFVHRAPERWRNLLMVACISPLLVSAVVRTYGWLVILGEHGVVASALQALGIAPPRMIFNTTGVVIGLVEILMPYMVLSLLAGFGRLHASLEEAASSLGAPPLVVFRRVVLPLTLPGILLGCLLAFVLSVSSFITPKLLGVGRVFLLATEIYDQAIVTLLVLVLFAFLLAPVILVFPMSFSADRVLAWPPSGFSLRWYGAMFTEPGLMEAAWNSLVLGCVVTVLSLLVATPAALMLARRRFAGRDAVMALLTAPLLLPTIVLGLAMLIVFVSYGLVGSWPGLVLAHLLLTLPYALRVLSTALSTLPATVEEAAASLGAPPGAVFRRITLPLMLPGVVATCAIVFLVSFDEVVVSLFIVGPRLVTLPVALYRYVESRTDPLVAAVSSVLVLLTLCVVLVLDRAIGLRRAVGK